LISKFKLNILWLENKLGISIDQIQSDGPIPLTKFVFWPKSDAYDQIRLQLSTRPWILNEDKRRLLDSTASIMARWQKDYSNTRTAENNSLSNDQEMN